MGIYIQIRFYDSDGVVLREGFDSSDKLNAGDSWKFTIMAPDEAAKYEITTISIVVPD